MIFNIDKKTEQKTTDCNKDFDCLTNEKHIFCTGKYLVRKDLALDECLSENRCYYRMSLGQMHFCTCPTRKEIFNKYGI